MQFTQAGIIALIPTNEKARHGIPYTPYPGTTTVVCPGCKEECWIGPEQRKKADQGFHYLCMVCIIKESEPGTVYHTLPLTDK